MSCIWAETFILTKLGTALKVGSMDLIGRGLLTLYVSFVARFCICGQYFFSSKTKKAAQRPGGFCTCFADRDLFIRSGQQSVVDIFLKFGTKLINQNLGFLQARRNSQTRGLNLH
jgi:hypothetical protein